MLARFVLRIVYFMKWQKGEITRGRQGGRKGGEGEKGGKRGGFGSLVCFARGVFYALPTEDSTRRTEKDGERDVWREAVAGINLHRGNCCGVEAQRRAIAVLVVSSRVLAPSG